MSPFQDRLPSIQHHQLHSGGMNSQLIIQGQPSSTEGNLPVTMSHQASRNLYEEEESKEQGVTSMQ